MRTRTSLLAILLTSVALTWPPTVGTAWAFGGLWHRHHSGCHQIECPRCHCKVSVDEVTEKKTCFEVTCEPICIPRVHFPWEKCCQPKCARIKYVHVAKKESYECKRYKYKFEPVCCEPCGCACGDGEAPVEGATQYEGGGLPAAPAADAAVPVR